MSNKIPVVSVIMACYNSSKFMDEAIASVLNQSFRDFEFVIVDDCSSDNSLEIAQKYQEIDERVMVISLPKNSGAAAARNAAIQKSKGNLIGVFDSDDICKPYRLQMQFDFMKRNPQVALVSGALEYIDDAGVVLGRTYPVTRSDKIRNKMLKGGNIIVNPAVMMRREAFSCCGGYCEALPPMEDHHLWVKYLRSGYHLSILPQVMISYRLNDSAISGWGKSDEQMRLFEQILEYDNPPQDLLDLYHQEVERGKTMIGSHTQRVALIQNTLHYRISRLAKRLRMESVIERILCIFHNWLT